MSQPGGRTGGLVGLAREALTGGLLLRYLLVALVKVVLDFAAFNAVILGVGEPRWAHLVLANSCGFLAAGWVAYRLNSSFAFRVERRPGDFGRFLVISLGGGLLYNGALLVLVDVFGASGSLELNLAKVAALGASAGWNFLGYALFVFRRRTVPEAAIIVADRTDVA